MQQKDLKPAGTFAQQYGVKMAGYGPPGSGKTPLVNTAPRPVMLICEPGMLSMRGSNVPAWDGFTVERIDEFFKWIFSSNEAKNFDTICVDSISQMAEIRLSAAKKNVAHGLKAYGIMSEWVYGHLANLYYTQNKHTYLIAKEGDHETNGAMQKRMIFPGKELNTSVPHLYDLIGRVAKVTIPGMNGLTLAVQTNENFNGFARDRTAKLAEYEPPNLANIFAKAMS